MSTNPAGIGSSATAGTKQRTRYLEAVLLISPFGFIRSIDGIDQAVKAVVEDVLEHNGIRAERLGMSTTHIPMRANKGFRQTEAAVGGNITCTVEEFWVIKQEILNGLADIEREHKRAHSRDVQEYAPRHEH